MEQRILEQGILEQRIREQPELGLEILIQTQDFETFAENGPDNCGAKQAGGGPR